MDKKENYTREEMLEALGIGNSQFAKLQKKYLLPKVHYNRELTGFNTYTHEALELLLQRNTDKGFRYSKNKLK